MVCYLAFFCSVYRGAAQAPAEASGRPGDGRGLFITNTDTAQVMQYWQLARDCQQAYPDSAIQLLQMAKMHSAQMSYLYGVARSLAHMGTIYAHTGRYEESIVFLKESIRYAKRSPQSTIILPIIYKDMGGVYTLTGDYEKAALYGYQAALLAEKAAALPLKGNIMNNLAVTLLTVDSALQSVPGKSELRYLELAEQYARKSGNKSLQATALLNKGSYYLKHNAWTKAAGFLQHSLQLSRQHHFAEKEHNSLLLLGQLAYARGHYNEALHYLQLATQVEETVNPYYRVTNLALLGETFFALHQPIKSLYYLDSALRKAKMLGLRYNLSDIHYKLYALYKRQGRPAEALQHYEQYVYSRDSIHRTEGLDRIRQLELKYHTAQKDKELLRRQVTIVQQGEQLRRKSLWTYLAAGVATGLALLSGAGYLVFRNRQRLQQQRMQNLEQGMEIGKLRASLAGEEKERSRLARELHNGIGGLLTAARINYMVIGQQDPSLRQNSSYQEVLQMLETISREVRKVSHNLMPEILQHNSLAEAIRLYCMQLQKDDEPRIDLQAFGPFEQLQPDLALIVYRIAQELVQNVIKHAQAQQLVVHLLLHEDLLSLTVEDDGKGGVRQENQAGMGLHTLVSLVEQMNGSVSVDSSAARGTSVYVEIPLLQYQTVKSI